VTLAFLGERPAGELAAVARAGQAAAEGVPAFEARLRGTGFFPNEGSPRVWFAKAEGEGFEPLAASLRASLGAEEEGPFKPHVTLARKKGPAPRPGPLVFDRPWQVSELSLVRSVLRSVGPAYEIVERFPLARPSAPQEAPKTLVEET
jgi:2'-5' RNA ligase